jgi:DNA-binding transcriptional ArsR family regulator
MKPLPLWVKIPNGRIEARGLRHFRWLRGEGADNVAALMGLTAISHHVESENGIARLPYDALCDITGLSRAKLARGLDVLRAHALIEREPDGRSSYKLVGYNPAQGWAKFPARGLYRNGVITAFSEFRLRLPAELEAMKLYFLFASRRDRRSNLAKITYDTIEDYSGVPRNNVKRAVSLLAASGLVHVERVASLFSDYGVANAYRLAHLDSYRHMGTSGRAAEIFEPPNPVAARLFRSASKNAA